MEKRKNLKIIYSLSLTGLIFYNEDDSQTLILLPNQTESISIISSNKNVEFSLVSVHSQINNVTLSYDDPTKEKAIKRDRKITSLNVGLIVFFDNNNYPKQNSLYLKNENKQKLRVYIRVLQFDGNFPIPGGCNLEFPILISPFLKLTTTKFNLTLEYQKASLGYNFRILRDKQDCDFSNNQLAYEIYSYYLKENDYSEQEYFLALRRMSKVDLIETYGTKLENQIINQPKTRVKILAYRGKGVIYNVIVSFLNFKIAYTPVVSYDCDLKDSSSCRTYQNWFEILYFLAFGLTGLLISLDASKHLKYQILYFGFLSGSVVTFILASKYAQFNLVNIYLTISIGGLLTSLIWFLVWFKYSSIRIALALSGIHFGFLFISILLSFNILSTYQAPYSLTNVILVTFGIMLLPICSLFIESNKVDAFTKI